MLLSLIVFSKSAKNLKKDNNNRDSIIVLRNPNNHNLQLIAGRFLPSEENSPHAKFLPGDARN